jgi:hypothetical protein
MLTSLLMLLVLLLLTTPVTVDPVPLAPQPTPAVDALVPVPLTALREVDVVVPTAVFKALLLAVMLVLVFVLLLVLEPELLPPVAEDDDSLPPQPVKTAMPIAISALAPGLGKQKLI